MKNTPRTPLITRPQSSSAAVAPPPAAREGCNPPDVVGFGAPVYYLVEDVPCAIDIVRVGDLAGECDCNWETEDASAVAGEQYNGDSGHVHFGDQEWIKTIHINGISDDFWAPTLEFKINLTDEEGCLLSSNLSSCRVKICDDDPFPSSKYKDQLLGGKAGLKSINGLGLFWEYFKLNKRARGMKWRTYLVILADQGQNLYLAFTIFVSMYLVDVLFKDEEGTTDRLWAPTRQETATLIGIIYVSPRLILHIWAIIRVHLDISGRARRFLQEGLFRKYMNYSESSRNEVKESDMLVSITEDCSELAEAYMGLLNMAGLGGKLLVLSFFVLRENPGTLWACIVMPSLMLLFAATRINTLIETAGAEGDMQVDMVALADETCDKFRLIAAYGQKPEVCDMFQQKVRDVKQAHLISNRVDCNNNQVPGWVGAAFVGGYIAFNAPYVLDETQKLGVFLATVAILDQIASDFAEFYGLVMQLAKSLEPLKGLTHLFNLPMDLEVLQQSSDLMRAKTKAKIDAVLAGSNEGATGTREEQLKFAADKVDIELVDVSFQYRFESGVLGAKILDKVSLAVAQASMVALTGEHGAGRSTFCDMMGGVNHPDSGFIFVPQHLRSLNVAQEPVLLSLSLLENLTFGGTPTGVGGRIQKILHELEMPHIVKVLDEELAFDESKAKKKAKKAAKEAKKAAVGRNGARMVLEAKNRKANNQALAELSEEESDSEEEDSEEEEEEEDESNLGSWHETATYTDRVKIHLARALIVNPEVMVLQRPLYHFDKAQGMKILAILKRFVVHRGFCLPGGQKEEDRRPRTVFFVPEDLDHCAEADIVWHLSGSSHKVREFKGSDSRKMMSPEFELL